MKLTRLKKFSILAAPGYSRWVEGFSDRSDFDDIRKAFAPYRFDALNYTIEECLKMSDLAVGSFSDMYIHLGDFDGDDVIIPEDFTDVLWARLPYSAKDYFYPKFNNQKMGEIGIDLVERAIKLAHEEHGVSTEPFEQAIQEFRENDYCFRYQVLFQKFKDHGITAELVNTLGSAYAQSDIIIRRIGENKPIFMKTAFRFSRPSHYPTQGLLGGIVIEDDVLRIKASMGDLVPLFEPEALLTLDFPMSDILAAGNIALGVL